jgi:hypothetical protein
MLQSLMMFYRIRSAQQRFAGYEEAEMQIKSRQ